MRPFNFFVFFFSVHICCLLFDFSRFGQTKILSVCTRVWQTFSQVAFVRFVAFSRCGLILFSQHDTDYLSDVAVVVVVGFLTKIYMLSP